MHERSALKNIPGIRLPDSSVTREATQLLRDTRDELLFAHSVRVYLWAALEGARRATPFDPELLYVGAMFHDLGLTSAFNDSSLRFEVDGANAAREFLRCHGLTEADATKVWMAIALHTTPGIPEFLHAEAALLQTGAAMDVAGRFYDDFTDQEREAVTSAYPREPSFERRMIETFKGGLRHRPATVIGTFNDDFLAFEDPTFQRVDMCCVMLSSPWTQRAS